MRSRGVDKGIYTLPNLDLYYDIYCNSQFSHQSLDRFSVYSTRHSSELNFIWSWCSNLQPCPWN